MLAYTYTAPGTFALLDKPKPRLLDPRDAIVRVTLSSICTSDLHIKHGSVPRAVPGITLGHEMVGVVEEVGSQVSSVRPGDRVTVNVETFCGHCFFCQHGWVNNCTDPQRRLGPGLPASTAVRRSSAPGALRRPGSGSYPPRGSPMSRHSSWEISLATGYWATGIGENSTPETPSCCWGRVPPACAPCNASC